MKTKISSIADNKTRALERAFRGAAVALMLGLGTNMQAAQADLSRLVIVGDSLMAGYQNGSLRGSQQIHGMAALIAKQAGVSLELPLIAEPGIPNALTLVDPGPPPVVVPLPGVSSGRLDPLMQTYNLAVPGQRVQDTLTSRPDFPIDSLTDLVLGLPGLLGGVSRSQVEWAEALHPTTIIVWIGANDTLVAALTGDASQVTPEAEFTLAYSELMQRLAATGASLVVANIPDITVIPYLTSAEEVASELGIPLSFLGPVIGIGPGDYVTPDALPYIEAILGGSETGPLPEQVVLTADEVSAVRAATTKFNTLIAAQAQEYGAALVDLHSFLNSLRDQGLVVHGQRLTTHFLGGLFSLDGIHPTNTGQAATANEFIKVLDTQLGASLPPIDLANVAKDDPLVLPALGHPASALTEVDEDTVGLLKAALVSADSGSATERPK